MTAITASEARARLYRLIDEAAETHQPLLITGKRNKAVLVSEEDWQVIVQGSGSQTAHHRFDRHTPRRSSA